MTARSWHWYLALQVAWWAWVGVWCFMYIVFGLRRNPEWYALLLVFNACSAVLMINSYRRCRRLHDSWNARAASLQEDLRLYVEQERWSKVRLTLDIMTIWKVKPEVAVPDHPGPEDPRHWSGL